MTSRTFTATIPATLPSLNGIYAGQHWTKRARLANEWHTITILACKDAFMFDGPVDITVTCTFPKGARLLDPDNLAAKLVIDGLKGLVIVDDSPRYVRSVTLGPCVRGERAETRIVVREAA